MCENTDTQPSTPMKEEYKNNSKNLDTIAMSKLFSSK